MRRRILTALVLSVLLFCACAYADVQLYRGGGSIGALQSIEDNAGLFVPLEDVGRIFGFSSRRNGEELLLTRGREQIRFMLDAGAAWRGMSILPVYSAPFERNGKIWIDTQSAVSIFQVYSGRDANSRLRFVKGNATPQPQTTVASVKPVQQPQTTPASVKPVTQPQTIVASVKPVQQPQTTPASVKPVTQPQPQAQPVIAASSVAPSSSGSFTNTPTLTASLPKQDVETMDITDIDSRLKELDEAIQLDNKPQTNSEVIDLSNVETPDDEPAPESKPEPKPKAKKSTPKPAKPSKTQPRLETFKAEDSKPEKLEYFSGTIQGIRWTASDTSTKKVKAVVETDDNADPQVFIADGSIHALFAGCLDNSEGLKSPYGNVALDINRTQEGVELVFTPQNFTKAEKLVLNNPRRIAFDFFFPDDADIPDNKPESEPEPQTSQPQTPTQPQQETSRPKPSIPTVITNTEPRRTSPAVTTPPSTLTIPTTPAGTRRRTIVIDPGHGGKDPGASDNGVVEKNINLAVGLELYRVLTAKGYRVIMTRNTDVYLTLQERTDIANDNNADLFVSVHVNALPSKKSMTGFEIYIMALPTDKDAMNLAKVENREYVEGKGMDVANVDRRTEMLLKILGDMQQNNKISESTDFAAALYNAGAVNGLPMHRIAQAPFFVLRGAGMPAVLLEIGFLTNAEEAAQLVNPVYQQRIAQAMAAGIDNYLR